MRMAGRTAIVTGGARGLGATYVRALVAEGAQVTVADVLDGEGRALVRDLSVTYGPRAIFARTDVTNETDTVRMAELAIEAFGKVDVLINNAGLYLDLERKKPFDEITQAEWDTVMAVNVRGAWQCVKAVFPYMQRQRYGKVINISSSSIYRGTPGLAHYVTSKAALIGLTRSLARELGEYNIAVNAIAPGLVSNEASTRLNPPEYFEDTLVRRSLKLLMTPEDLVGTVLFLASPDSNLITGQTIIVDGGAAMI